MTNLSAQDSAQVSVLIDGVEVYGDKMQFINAQEIQHFDAIQLSTRFSENIDQILKDYAGVNIKTYGYGGMSNISMRGSNSSQIAVLWNGFNLQDLLNGGVNLSLFPVYLMDDIQVKKGGSSALFGSGAMGGSIHLGNKLSFNEGLQMDFYGSTASFGQYQGGSSVRFSNKKLATLLKVYYKQAENNFHYVNTYSIGQPTAIQDNAQQQQLGILQENAILLTNHQRLNTAIWLQKNDQNLPPPMYKETSAQHRNDESARGQIAWSYFSSHYKVNVRNASLFSQMQYEDPEINLISEHQSFSNISEAEAIIKLRAKDELQFGLSYHYEKGISNQLQQNARRDRSALFAAYKIFMGKHISGNISFRKELVDDNFTPFTFSAGANLYDLGAFSFNLQVSKNYRVPTFNDLFWVDGFAKGNPDLKDESSWSEELGLAFQNQYRKQNISIGVTAFNTYYQNLIQWTPEQNIWTPMNQEEVWARGIESHLEYNTKIKKWKFDFKSRYVFTKSTIEKLSDANSDNIIGKQLILTPLHQGNASLNIQFQKIYIEYIQEFTGLRYTTSSNTEFLDAYTLGSAIIGWETSVFGQNAILKFRINNVWNTVYQSMPSYAMPLAHYEMSFKITIQTSKKHENE